MDIIFFFFNPYEVFLCVSVWYNCHPQITWMKFFLCVDAGLPMDCWWRGWAHPIWNFKGYFHPRFQILESDFIRPRGTPQLKSNIFIALPNEKESTFLTYNDGTRLFLVRLVTETRGHSANALDGIQTRAMGWTVGGFFFFFFFF